MFFWCYGPQPSCFLVKSHRFHKAHSQSQWLIACFKLIMSNIGWLQRLRFRFFWTVEKRKRHSGRLEIAINIFHLLWHFIDWTHRLTSLHTESDISFSGWRRTELTGECSHCIPSAWRVKSLMCFTRTTSFEVIIRPCLQVVLLYVQMVMNSVSTSLTSSNGRLLSLHCFFLLSYLKLSLCVNLFVSVAESREDGRCWHVAFASCSLREAI